MARGPYRSSSGPARLTSTCRFREASKAETFLAVMRCTANPDGSDLKVIVNEGRRLPDGIVVDVAGGHIYWINVGYPNASDGSVERADLDGRILPTLFLQAARSRLNNFNSTRSMASSIGRTAKTCT